MVETEALISTTVVWHTSTWHPENKYQGGMQNGDRSMAADGSSVKSKGYFFNGNEGVR